MRIYLYRVTDAFGNSDETCGGPETDECICLANVRDLNGGWIQFDSEPRHLPQWCKENGLTLQTSEIQFDWDGVLKLVDMDIRRVVPDNWDGESVDFNRYI